MGLKNRLKKIEDREVLKGGREVVIEIDNIINYKDQKHKKEDFIKNFPNIDIIEINFVD